MKTKLFPFLTAAALAFGWFGCIPSINPILTEKDIAFDPALVGTWSEDDGSGDRWIFTKDGSDAYRLVVFEEGKESAFRAVLGKIGEHRYLQLFPDDAPINSLQTGTFYKGAFIPTHLFLKTDLKEQALRLYFLKPEWLEKTLQADPKAIAHAPVEGRGIVLTASTGELQAFLKKHADNAEAWTEPAELKRRKD